MGRKPEVIRRGRSFLYLFLLGHQAHFCVSTWARAAYQSWPGHESPGLGVYGSFFALCGSSLTLHRRQDGIKGCFHFSSFGRGSASDSNVVQTPPPPLCWIILVSGAA